jgi:hypothetical protein
MSPWLAPWALALAGCAPALAVTASASIPPAVAASAPASKGAEGEQPDRDPQARGAGPLYASDLPDDRDGNGLAERAPDACADPERLEGCARGR